MNIETNLINVNGLNIEVVRKHIKNLHLGVYPPNGRIRVAAPLAVSDDAVRLAVVSRMPWIRRQKSKFEAQSRQSLRKYISGESHYFLGRRYRLRLNEGAVRDKVSCGVSNYIVLDVRVKHDSALREKVFLRWYREELKKRAATIVEKWSSLLKIEIPNLGIRRMKTKWGTCNTNKKKIWINLELVKKPPQCLEYIIVHELVHFFERNHNERFISIMDNALPNWRFLRQELNAEPLAHEEWEY